MFVFQINNDRECRFEVGTKGGRGKGMGRNLQKEQFGAPDICDICMAHYA